MPHKDAKSAGANGARRQGKRDNRTEAKDTTPVCHGTDGYTPPRRKSGPGRWVRLADLLLATPDGLLGGASNLAASGGRR